MGLPIVSGASATLLTVDPVSDAARVSLYDQDGVPIPITDKGTFSPSQSQGVPVSGADGPVARVARASSNGSVRGGEQALVFCDSIEGAAVDTQKWTQALTTMTITQAVALGILLNASNIGTTATGAQQVSAARFPIIGRNGLIFRARVQSTAHSNNNLIEVGFGSPATAITGTIGDGAIWQKDGSGQYVPVVTMNSGTELLGVPVADATFRAAVAVNEYASFEIFLEDSRATFRILTSAGAIVDEQVLTFGGTMGTFGVTGLQALIRTYNVGVVAVPVQTRVSQVSVWYSDFVGPTEEQSALWNNNGSASSPTTYLTIANYANSIAPASATLSNTTAGFTTLGGQWQFVAVAGAETDYALFAIQMPTSKGFTVKRVSIDAFVTVVAVATTATVMQWGLGFGGSVVSLAAGTPLPARKAIGVHSFPIGAAVGATGGPAVVWDGAEKVQAGRFFHVILKMPIGTATATQIFRGTCTVNGFFE